MRFRVPTGALLAAAIAAPALAQDHQEVPTDGQVLYGVHRTNGQLVRYDFEEGTLITLGHVRTPSKTLLGIEAAAYIPGFTNLYAFWLDPSDNKSKLVYVDIENGEAVVTHPLEGGKMGGAVAAKTLRPGALTDEWVVFATQVEEVTPPFTVGGKANINPNNSTQNEFELRTPTGMKLTRDDLHKDTRTDGNATFYQGPATYLRLKPKGNGNQNSLIINGEAFPLKNSNTYAFSGEMQVRVYNDQVNGGKAMGHWWIQVTGTANWADDVEVLTPHRLVEVNHKNGEVTELMVLSRGYDGLATTDGQTFFATHGEKLFKLVPSLESETLIGSMNYGDVLGLEFCNSTLTGFETGYDRLNLLQIETGQTTGTPQSLSTADLGTIVYVPRPDDPTLLANNYD